MKHANKMILVPVEKFDESSGDTCKSLITSLRKALDTGGGGLNEKIDEISNILSQYRKSEGTDDQQKQQQASLNPLDLDDETILAGIPPKFRKQAHLLLSFVKRNPRIKWNERGELMFDGRLVPNSNFIDLLHDFSRERTSRPAATGSEIFAKALYHQNVPFEAIGNKARLSLLNKNVFYTTRPPPSVIKAREKGKWESF